MEVWAILLFKLVFLTLDDFRCLILVTMLVHLIYIKEILWLLCSKTEVGSKNFDLQQHTSLAPQCFGISLSKDQEKSD